MTPSGVRQRTIARAVECTGSGLHLGERCKVRLLPAPENTGIVFVRTDLPGRPRIAATAENRIAQPRRTAIMCGEAEVHTVEHLISAVVGTGIDNLLVEIDGPEAPGLDGSAVRYVELLREAGVAEQARPRREIVLREPIWLEGRNGSSIAAEPWSDGLLLSYTLDYPPPMLQNQVVELVVTDESYERELAPARTFVMKEEAELLQQLGMGAGANFDNTIVYDMDGPMQGVALRFKDEAARHKLLDLVGDLALLGARLRARVTAVKSGHELNLELANAILALEAREAAPRP
jgi:UDP-3-O-acyl N-acetylglucosamine deacetylase